VRSAQLPDNPNFPSGLNATVLTDWLCPARTARVPGSYAIVCNVFCASGGGLSIATAAVLTVAVIADFPLQIWLLIVSIMLIRKREAVAARTPVYGS